MIETRSTVPPRALVVSGVALAIPVATALLHVQIPDSSELLIWLLPILPSFLFAYYRGWKGAATALAAGMAALSLTQSWLALDGRHLDDWPLLFAIVSAFILITIGIGILSELIHRAREDAVQLALKDELTALPNRRYAQLFIDKEFHAARRGRALTVVMFDLDAFKRYNDTFGHRAGDEALKAFGRALLTNTRAMNLSARFGGEEFLAILSAADIAGTLVFVRRVQEALARELGDRPTVTVSAGVAAYNPRMESTETLIAAADRALYRAKRDGGNLIRIAEDTEEEVEGALDLGSGGPLPPEPVPTG